MTADNTAAGNTAAVGGKIGDSEFVWLLAGLMALNSLAIDIMLPAFPDISSTFGMGDSNRVQFVILAYLFGFGGGQLIFGPVSDRFGRRGPLFVGCAFYIAFSLLGAFSANFEILLAARFAQGIGAAATRVIALAIIRDCFSGRQMASRMSLIMMVFMVVPVVAPFVGQGIIMFGEWHLIFLFMATIATIVVTWIYYRLPETLDLEKRRPLTALSVMRAFAQVLSNRLSASYAAAATFFYGGLLCYVYSSQQLIGETYNLGAWFPFAFAATAGMMAVFSFMNSRLVERFGQRRLSHGALLLFLGLSAVLAILAGTDNLPFGVFLVTISTIIATFGLVMANFNSIALEPLGSIAGTASSVLGFTQTVIGGAIGAFIGQAYDGTTFPLAVGLVSVAALSLICVLIGENGRLFGVGPQE